MNTFHVLKKIGFPPAGDVLVSFDLMVLVQGYRVHVDQFPLALYSFLADYQRGVESGVVIIVEHHAFAIGPF